MKNLILITEHSDYLESTNLSDAEKWQLHRKRVLFGKRQPQLGDFVPCGEDGLPLDKNMVFADKDRDYAFESDKFDVYQKALDKVLFKGFEIKEYADNVEFVKAIVCPNNVTHIAWYSKITCSWHLSKGITTLESLTPYNLELTDNANKII